MNLTDTTPSARPDQPAPSHPAPEPRCRSLGAALISIAACGADTATDAARTSASGTLDTTAPATRPPRRQRPPTIAPTAGRRRRHQPPPPPPPLLWQPAARPTAMLDELVDVDGVRVHVRCIGSGDTTVLLISGFEIGDENWGKVEPDIAPARVCSYARPGTAAATRPHRRRHSPRRRRNSAPCSPRSASRDRTWSSATPSVVPRRSRSPPATPTGDGPRADRRQPATWPAELCAVTDDGSGMAALIGANCAGWTDPTANAEHLDVFGSFEEVAGITELGSLPMTVITAVDRQFADRAPRAGPPHGGVEPGPAALGRPLDHSQVVSVEQTSHHIEIDRPEVVIDAVVELLP